jgi:ubiquinone/menaquinone biosynthesis C-methylase UbiE
LKSEKLYKTKTQLIELTPIRTAGFILDIGGGGEGVIGKLNGKQVIAIDKNKEELEEAHNKALKIIMDAADLKFLPNSFDVCTREQMPYESSSVQYSFSRKSQGEEILNQHSNRGQTKG